MFTIYAIESRRPSYRDIDGLEVVAKSTASTEIYTVDWSGLLASGETIGDATWTVDGGLSTANETNNGTLTYATISGSDGSIKITVDTDNSQTFSRTVHFFDPEAETA
jgi:hypothetical protein